MKKNTIQMKQLHIAILLFAFPFLTQAIDVVELRQPKSDKVVIKLMFRNGSMSDPAGKEGLTDLTASLITEGGTKQYTSTQISDLIYPWAASMYSSVDKEVSIFTFSMHKDHFDKFYPVVKDLMLSPRFDAEDFKRVKSNQQNYIDEVIRTSSDEEYSKKALEHLLFRGTAYQHPVAGTSNGVKSITMEDVVAHYRDMFNRNNVLIGLGGNYTEKQLETIKNDMAGLPDGKPAPDVLRPKPRVPEGLEVEIITKPNTLGSAIFAGFPMDLTRSNDDFAALMIANSWLGEHRKSYSRLYQKIREQRSMNYGDYTYIEWYQNGGGNMLPKPGYPRSSNYFSIWLRPVQTAKSLKGQYSELSTIETGHAHFALRMAISEMAKLIEGGMTPEDFELTKTFLKSYVKLYAQTTEQHLGYLMDSRFYQRKDWFSELDGLLEQCNLDDVNKAMRRYWQTQSFYVAIVTDESEAKPLAGSLLENRPSPMSYSNALKAVLSDEILAEDDAVSTYVLKVSKVDIIPSDKMFRN